MRQSTELHDKLRALVSEVAASNPGISLENLNRLIARRMDDYNTRPQAELGGLSPAQLARLLHEDWSGNGGLTLNRELTMMELAAADLLHDARTLLVALRDDGPMAVTQVGNLSRAVVKQLLPRLRASRGPFIAEQLLGGKVVNEEDVLWLNVLRHVLSFAGLIVRRKGFRITKRGREHVADDRVGELYALVFETLFRRLNLQVLDRSDRHAGLQGTIAFSFFKLRTSARDWSSPEKLAAEAWLESAKDPPTPGDVQYGDMRHWSFRHRVLAPLVHFGLLEERELPAKEKWSRPVEMRKTPLFDRFLRFELGADAVPRSGPR